jgi:dTDP-glucose 4,6-dehydratase
MQIVVTGGAGFVGSHLCDTLIARGDYVVCLDNLSTGRLDNIAHLIGRPEFQLAESAVSAGVDVHGQVDAVAHFASAASPPDYQCLPPCRRTGGPSACAIWLHP